MADEDLLRDPEPNDFTPAALTRKLARATRIANRLNELLRTIAGNVGAPPDPTKPPMQTSVSELSTALAEAQTSASQIAAQLR